MLGPYLLQYHTKYTHLLSFNMLQYIMHDNAWVKLHVEDPSAQWEVSGSIP
jgi:hypothetical protein